MFGPEDGSLGRATLAQCYRFLVIPTRHCANLSAAVYTVLYDRHAKRVHDGLELPCSTAGDFDEPDHMADAVGVSCAASSAAYTRSIRTMVIRFSSISYSTRRVRRAACDRNRGRTLR